MAKNEEKPCPEIFTNQKLKFSANLVENNAILTNFLTGIFLRVFFRFLQKKWLKFFSFLAKNENAKILETIVMNKENDLCFKKSFGA